MSGERVSLTIDGRAVQVPPGTLVLDAARQAGVEIPVFCSHDQLDPVAVCRICLVEVEGSRKLVPACSERVREGMVVRTDTPQVAEARKSVLEFLLINHPLDCPVCDKGGECDLQDLTYQYGPALSRLADAKMRKPKAVDLGPFIVLDEERCILCRRCTRFDHQVAQERTLVVGQRAHEALITTAEGVPYASVFSGNTIELCPVGALTSKFYRFRARPWDLVRVDEICHGCPVGCHIQLHFRANVEGARLERVVSRPFEPIDDGWLCDRGRFNYGFVQSPERIAQPLVRPLGAPRGTLVPTSWEEAFRRVVGRLQEVLATQGPQGVGFIGGGRLTNEEAYLLQRLARQVVGTENVDHRVAGEAAASLDVAPGRITDLDRAAVILVVGAHPGQSAPVVDLRIRRAAARQGALLLTLGPVDPELRVPHQFLPAAPGHLADRLEALAQSLAGGGEGVPPRVAQELHEREGLLVALWDGREAAAGRALAVFLQTWQAQGREARLLVVGDQANSRGAEAAGLRPDLLPGYRLAADPEARRQAGLAPEPAAPGLSTQAMLEHAVAGRLGFLYLVGANLVETFPDRALATAALESEAFVVVQDLFLTETARLADVVLPAAPFTARVGHLTNLEGRVQATGPRSTDPAVGLPVEAWTDGQIFEHLGEALQGRPLVAGAGELATALAAAGLGSGTFAGALPVALLHEASDGSPTPSGSGEGLVAAPLPTIHGGGGTSRFDRAYGERRPLAAVVYLNPEDAQRWGVVPGDRVGLEAGDGVVEAEVQVTRRVMAGVLGVPRGVPGLAWNRLTGAGRVRVRGRLLEEVG